jgi:hypothetical protein
VLLLRVQSFSVFATVVGVIVESQNEYWSNEYSDSSTDFYQADAVVVIQRGTEYTEYALGVHSSSYYSVVLK